MAIQVDRSGPDEELHRLTERLAEGDPAAAEELFQSYAPYLRMVVRRQLNARLRARFDSEDVVQSVWADTLLRVQGKDLSWTFRDAAGLRGFLVRLTQNRLIDFIRKHRRSLSRERPLGSSEVLARSVHAGGDRASEQVHLDDAWKRLLGLCHPDHRDLLRLRRAGASLDEMAEASGLHPSSVRRIFYDLADRFVSANDEKVGPSPRSPTAVG